jgi:hypothetical protein
VKLSLYRSGRPLGLREVEAPTFSDIRLTDGTKVVSPKRRPLFTPTKIPGTHVSQRLSRPQGHSVAGRIRFIEKKSTSSGTRTGDLRPCSIVPQQTTLQRRYNVFPVRYGLNFYINLLGGGVEYLHRNPASRRRRRKGKSQI